MARKFAVGSVPAVLGPHEREFVATRDHFFMATVGEDGWPYVQHRGGPVGFIHVLDDHTIAFADYSGNRQYVSVGNLKTDGRAALILMDYPNQRRLKILGRVELHEAAANPDLMAQLTTAGYKAKIERAMVIHIEAFDWNCPQHITPRFTAEEIEHALEPMRKRMKELEEKLAKYETAG
ncbi:MAG: pyridoxamine 5'-phosphate oxidase family protein [Acidobacteriota bacterium]